MNDLPLVAIGFELARDDAHLAHRQLFFAQPGLLK